ncbi:MAG: hypothetical protein FJY97_14490, partial [candidate division Zixibacteria bacterium]|nr:hypothetical protein [candidate division Zixibacteria bacterium]
MFSYYAEKWAVEWRLFLTVWLVCLFHLAPLTGANENRYLDLVRSIVDEGRFEIDTYHYNTIDKSYRDGHYYAGAAPGPAFLAAPVYLIFRAADPFLPASLFGQFDKASHIRGYLKGHDAPDAFVAAYPFGKFLLSHLLLTASTCSLFAALIAVVLYRISRQVGRSTTESLFIGLACVFGTTIFYYSTRLYPHVLGAGFAFFAFALIVLPRLRSSSISPIRCVLAGLFLGMAALMDYAVAPAAGLAGLYVLLTLCDRRILFAVLGGLAPIALLLVYNTVCFGSPFKTAYGFPNGPVDDGTHVYYTHNFHGFSLPPINQLWGLSFGFFRGIVWYVPVTVLAVYGVFKALREKPSFRLEWRIVAGIAVAQFLFNAMMHPNYWIGGYEFGPRFLTPMLPFLLLGLAFSSGLWTKARPFTISAIVVSGLINWIGVQYAPSNSLSGVIAMFLLSGPASPLYLFERNYVATYTDWQVTISPWGGY